LALSNIDPHLIEFLGGMETAAQTCDVEQVMRLSEARESFL
jgi:hypothetical protein